MHPLYMLSKVSRCIFHFVNSATCTQLVKSQRKHATHRMGLSGAAATEPKVTVPDAKRRLGGL